MIRLVNGTTRRLLHAMGRGRPRRLQLRSLSGDIDITGRRSVVIDATSLNGRLRHTVQMQAADGTWRDMHDPQSASAAASTLSHVPAVDTNSDGGQEPPRSQNDDQSKQAGDEAGLTLAVVPPGIRFAHHFDTYRTYKMLAAAGYSSEQAIVIMKCMRGILLDHLLQAKGTYLSKAEMENEAYLFDAACSELRTEMQNNRKSQAQLEHTEITALQREFLALKRQYEEEIQNMKTEISVEVNDRQNTMKVENRAKELQVQELNNRITILITSDLRSQVEALRWQTTRRGLCK